MKQLTSDKKLVPEDFRALVTSLLPGEKLLGVDLIKEENHVFHLKTTQSEYFVKTYTKSWYQDKLENEKGEIVRHEEYAFRLLAGHGLASPEIVAARYTTENELGQPFLMTRKLQGDKLTDILQRADSRSHSFHETLEKAGQYLKKVHSINSPYYGYINESHGRSGYPKTSDWHHRSWTALARQEAAFETLAGFEDELEPDTLAKVKMRFETMANELVDEYAVNRMIHGDCHPHQFFLYRSQSEWRVSGFVDLEVSGFGDAVEDLLKFGIEMAREFPAKTNWWRYFFAGYGQEPNYATFKLRLLGASPRELKWPGGEEKIRSGMLAAKDWSELFCTGND